MMDRLKFFLSHKVSAGVLVLLCAGVMKWVGYDLFYQHVKVSNLPDPSSIALKVDVQSRFNELNAKIDANDYRTEQHLDRIDKKIDQLMLILIDHSRASSKLNTDKFSYIVPESDKNKTIVEEKVSLK